MLRSAVVFAVVSFAAACQPGSDAPDVDSAAKSPVENGAASFRGDSTANVYVQSFYTYYVPLALDIDVAGLDSVLIARPELFDGALLTALRRDAAARADAVGEIAGLDFDPFLAGQDPCERYEVGYTGLATSARDRRVPVFAVCGGERAAEPSVVAEISPRDTGWVFVNFLYPAAGANLLSVLERLHPVEQAL